MSIELICFAPSFPFPGIEVNAGRRSMLFCVEWILLFNNINVILVVMIDHCTTECFVEALRLKIPIPA